MNRWPQLSLTRRVILAAIEAKDESHAPGAGLQQALSYAVAIGAPFAFSSNGHGIVEQDLRTGQLKHLDAFPTPAQLIARWQTADPVNGPHVTNRRGDTCSNPIIQRAYSGPGTSALRYYQERAVTAAITEAVRGRNRALLALATGTGKTFIAFNIAHKLIHSGYAQKILFLADRISLRDQAFNEFAGFGEARGVVINGQAPMHRDIHFAIYQSLYAETASGAKLYETYPPDYFDVVIVDECHRSGYGDWGSVLQYFTGAFQLGMTATPKRTDSIDTYEFFAGENRDANDEPQSVFEYSFGRGIDDGYLATYRVYQIHTNIDEDGLDIDHEVTRGAELIVPEGQTAQDTYTMGQFERSIVVPDRTRVLCEHLAGMMLNLGIHDKTMIFCVTMEHADFVRSEMQRLLGTAAGMNLYAARIVSEERDGQAILEEFQLSTSREPVIATTVDLLTTGVNAPAVRNIVFMKPIASTTVFKQIIGRGSRIDAITGKTFFRIIDYTNATRLFDDWDLPPHPPADGPKTGPEFISGMVIDEETGDPVAAASISIRRGGQLLREAVAGPEGQFHVADLPTSLLDIIVAANGFNRRTVRVDTSESNDQIVIELRRPSEGGQRLRINGVDVVIAQDIQVNLNNGNEIGATEYLQRAKQEILALAPTYEDFRTRWIDQPQREQLAAVLAARQVIAEILSLVLVRTDADDYDLFAHAAFDRPIASREERARSTRQTFDTTPLPSVPSDLIDDLLDKYRLAGVTEIASAEVFSVPPLVGKWGGVTGVAKQLGGAEGVTSLLTAIQVALYSTEFDQ